MADRRRWRRRLRRLRRRIRYSRYNRRAKWVGFGFGALIGIAIVWIVLTGLLARRQLETLQNRLVQVQVQVSQGHIDEAKKLAADIPGMADRAESFTSGPAWWAAAQAPLLGEPFDVIRATTTATSKISTEAIPKLLDVASMVDPGALRTDGQTINIALLQRAVPDLDSAAGTLRRVTDDVSKLPSDTWISGVNTARVGLQNQLVAIKGYVVAAARTAKVLPSMLGADGNPRRYFIGLQNEAELRGTGGLPGAFAILKAVNGTITFERFASDNALFPPTKNHEIPTGLDFGPSYNALYGAGLPTTTFADSNVSPHFPYAAKIWAAMYEKTYKQRIDGALALDPTALSYFLTATGPTTVKGVGTVTAQNVVSLTQKDAYSLFSDNNQRKDFLVAVLKATADKVTAGAGAPYNLVKAASLSSSQQRLLVWSDEPAVQKLIAQTAYSGDLQAKDDRPFSGLVINNAAAGKLDYYLARNVEYTRGGCGPTRDVTATITLTNNAPAVLPAYVNSRGDTPPPGARPGDNHAIVDYFATGGASLQGVTVDGKRATASLERTLGRTVFRLDLELKRTTTTTIVLHLNEPTGKGQPRLWRQPGVIPMGISISDQSC